MCLALLLPCCAPCSTSCCAASPTAHALFGDRYCFPSRPHTAVLAIVPLTQAMSGNPPVDKLDLNQSLCMYTKSLASLRGSCGCLVSTALSCVCIYLLTLDSGVSCSADVHWGGVGILLDHHPATERGLARIVRCQPGPADRQRLQRVPASPVCAKLSPTVHGWEILVTPGSVNLHPFFAFDPFHLQVRPVPEEGCRRVIRFSLRTNLAQG